MKTVKKTKKKKKRSATKYVVCHNGPFPEQGKPRRYKRYSQKHNKESR